MQLVLHNKMELELGDELLADGTLLVATDNWPGCEGTGGAVYLNRDEALQVVAHLQKMFASGEPQSAEDLLARDLKAPMANAVFPVRDMLTGDGKPG